MIPRSIYRICSDNNIDILPSNRNCYEPDEHCILFCTRLKGENLIFTLLHEIGHALQYQTGYYDMHYEYPITHSNNVRNNNIFIYYILSSEYDAWERGRIIAKEYKIKLDEHRYIKYAALNTNKYIKTFLNKRLLK
jgi:Zn-dependent peptidase ImmA (M78 family)